MHDRVLDFITASRGEFDRLALDLFAWQRAHNPVYARIAGDVAPARVEEIPAVPVALFKSLDLCRVPDAPIVFRTSGTTGQARGVHRMVDTRAYDAGAVRWFRACVPDAPRRIVSMCPTDADSSLGHMVALFGDVTATMDAWPHLVDPVFLAATAFALDHLLAQPGEARLTPASVVMVTGGFKGRAVRLDSNELYRALARLGAPRVVGEYGMTELSSQLWTDPVDAGEVPGPFRAPPWMRVYTVDPSTGEPVDGEGLLRFVDLANVDGVLAIETMDVGRVEGDRVTLLGRLAGAEVRGCSLRAEEMLRR